MAKAQKEDGFLCLANALSEEFAARDFTERQHAILRVVERRTYGVRGAKVARLSSGQIAEATGIDASNIRKAVAALVSARVLVQTDEGIGFNTSIDDWAIQRRAPRVKTTRGEGRINPGQNNPGGGSKQPGIPGQNNPAPRVKTTREESSNASSDADARVPKDMKDMKDMASPCTSGAPTHGGETATTAPPSKMGSSWLDDVEWGEGEMAFWLGVLGYSRPGDLALLVGTSREAFRKMLARSPEARGKAIAYYRAAVEQGATIGKPLAYILAYLEDPMRYPALAVKPGSDPSKVVAMEPRRRTPAEFCFFGLDAFDDEMASLTAAKKAVEVLGVAIDRKAVPAIFLAGGKAAVAKLIDDAARAKMRSQGAANVGA